LIFALLNPPTSDDRASMMAFTALCEDDESQHPLTIAVGYQFRGQEGQLHGHINCNRSNNDLKAGDRVEVYHVLFDDLEILNQFSFS